jgi:hypothetical protein
MKRSNPPDPNRHTLRLAMGHVERKSATGRINSPMVQQPRRPSMPIMPWDRIETPRDKATEGDND